MPNIKGWSRNDVLTFAKLINLNVTFEGTGYVDSFNIKRRYRNRFKCDFRSKN
ncbi:MAG: hypothetical protein L6V81_03220 [Clostridium sp.]|nr:MAG: hypothetical protein L6V81_03220 [Clostridium sp.]